MSPHQQMIALSIRQPFAEQIMAGVKQIEFRGQRTKLRGRIYVYACKTHSDSEWYDEAGLNPDDLPHGMIVGTVEIVNCVRGEGEFEWQLANPVRFHPPISITAMPQPVFFWPFGKPDKQR